MCAVREDSLENICIICICIGFVGHQTADGKHLLGRAADDHVVAHVAAQEHTVEESWGQVFDSIMTSLAYRRLSREGH